MSDDDLERRLNKLEINQGIDDGIHKWIRTVCVTSTMSFLGFISWIANWSYDKFDAIQAGIKAFLETLRHGQ